MTNLRERLTKVFVEKLKESHENSKEMIASNSTSFDEMGMAHTAPGEFAQEEITDHSNLENTGSMANDTEFSGKEHSGCEHCDIVSTAVDKIDDTMDDLASDIVDISIKDDEEDEDIDIDVDSEEDDEDEDEKKLMALAHESVKGSLINAFQKELRESNGDYAGPQDFVPDTRIHTSAVLNALKDKIGEGSEGIHVDQDQDDKDHKTWIVTQVDENELPDTLEVMNVTLKKDGNKYKVEEIKKDFPVMK